MATATSIFGAGPRVVADVLVLLLLNCSSLDKKKGETEAFSCAIRVYLEANHMAFP
jgi:hypothetical protein